MQNPNISINVKSLKNIIENVSNKTIKIHDLYKQVGTNVSDLFKVIENIYSTLNNQSNKIKIKNYQIFFPKYFHTKKVLLNT